MNLIEQLGGYERANKIANCKSGVVHLTKPMLDALLEYRREHNIFEVGDFIAEPNLTYPYLYKIYEISGLLIKVESLTTNRKSISFESDIRHATDEEIKAGHRISHGTDNLSHFDHCADIANHISPLTKVTER